MKKVLSSGACILLVIGTLLFSQKLHAQVSVNANYSLSTVLAKDNTVPRGFTDCPSMGAEFKFYPFKNHEKISLSIGYEHLRRGYKQGGLFKSGLVNRDDVYTHNLKGGIIGYVYHRIPVKVHYSLKEKVSLNAGLSYDYLKLTNLFKEEEVMNTKNVSLILGATFFPESRFCVLASIDYGFLPVMHYEKIGDFGEFLGQHDDYYNFAISVGVAWNIYKKKIKFYEK